MEHLVEAVAAMGGQLDIVGNGSSQETAGHEQDGGGRETHDDGAELADWRQRVNR